MGFIYESPLKLDLKGDKGLAKQRIPGRETILCKIMEVQEHGLFRNGQNIHVAVYVARDSVDGGWVVTEQ